MLTNNGRWPGMVPAPHHIGFSNVRFTIGEAARHFDWHGDDVAGSQHDIAIGQADDKLARLHQNYLFLVPKMLLGIDPRIDA